MARVLIADDLDAKVAAFLADRADTAILPGLPPERLLAEVAGAQALIVRSGT